MLIPKQHLTLSSQILTLTALTHWENKGGRLLGSLQGTMLPCSTTCETVSNPVSRGFLRHCSALRKKAHSHVRADTKLQTSNSLFGASFTSCISLIGLICGYKINTDISKVGVNEMISSPAPFDEKLFKISQFIENN